MEEAMASIGECVEGMKGNERLRMQAEEEEEGDENMEEEEEESEMGLEEEEEEEAQEEEEEEEEEEVDDVEESEMEDDENAEFDRSLYSSHPTHQQHFMEDIPRRTTGGRRTSQKTAA
jgi:archaellum component FlaD/FlaE